MFGIPRSCRGPRIGIIHAIEVPTPILHSEATELVAGMYVMDMGIRSNFLSIFPMPSLYQGETKWKEGQRPAHWRSSG